MAKSNPIGPVDPALAKLGFIRPKAVVPKSISIDAAGKTKDGKTHLMLTMTQPIGILNTDRALEDQLNRDEFKDIDVIVKDMSGMFSPGEELTKEQGVLIEREFAKGYNALLAHKYTRSIGVDKWNTMWEVARYAEFGKASVKAHHYVPVNMRMRGYLAQYQNHDKNLILLSDVKEEWVNEKPTGRWIVDGFKYTPGMCQVNAFLWREEDGDRDFKLKITGCGLNADLVGEEYTNEEIDFKKLAPFIVPESMPKDWR